MNAIVGSIMYYQRGRERVSEQIANKYIAHFGPYFWYWISILNF